MPVPRILGPKFGWIRWPAYTSDRNVFLVDFLNSPSGVTVNRIFTEYGNRAPSLWDNYSEWGPGVPDLTVQTIIDNELLIAGSRGACDFWSYNWFPPPSCFVGDPSNMPKQSGIMLPPEAHRLSPYKDLVKIVFMISPLWFSYNTSLPLPGNWGRAAQYRAHLIACFNESSYFKFNGRPVIGVYGYSSMSASDKAEWLNQLDLLAAEYGGPLYIAIQDHDVTAGQAMASRGARWLTTYGPNPGPAGVVNGVQYPWSLQAASDITNTNWIGSVSGGALQLYTSVTPFNDRRPRSVGTWWIDQPTMPELVDHLSALYRYTQAGFGSLTPEFGIGYSWDEIDEGGPGITPSFQEHTRYIDALSWVRTGIFPELYLYQLDARQKNFTQSGVWTPSAQTPGMFNNDDMISGGPGDYIDFSHVRSTQLGIVCSYGPTLGIGEVLIDGVLAGTINQFSPTPLYQQLGFMSTTLSCGTHTIRFREAAGSPARVSYDACRIVYKP